MNPSCLLCSQPMSPWMEMPIDAKKWTPIRCSRISRCTNCAFGAILPRPTEQEITDSYRLANYYTQNRSHFRPAGRVTFWDRLRVHLAWRLDFGTPMVLPDVLHEMLGKAPSDICDIGCGHGFTSVALAELGHRVIGVEVDPRAAEEAIRRGALIHEGTAEQLPDAVSGRSFDLVILSHVLEHTLEPGRAVSNAAGLLKPGGRLVCEVPNCAAAGLDHSGLAWEPLDVPRHLNFFAAANLRFLCEQASLKVEKIYYHQYSRQFKNEWINTERRIWEALRGCGLAMTPEPSPNSGARAWGMLARTAFAGKHRKYDSVGIIAAQP